MTKKKLRYSFNQVINAADRVRCEDLHHKESQRHEAEYMCPVLYELNKHMQILLDYMKEQKIS